MYTDENGYLAQPWIKDKVHELVRLAIAEGLYVIIDWHILKDRNPMWNVGAAKAFFDEMSRTYGKHPNIIYEICNEPNGEDVTWDRSIKPYAEQVIPVIRKNDPHNIIVVGTPRWSSDLDAPARNRLSGDSATNVMYSFHYYAGSHGDVSGKLSAAIDRGLPVFVSEWGVSTADGRSGVARWESEKFLEFLARRRITWAAWSLADDGNSSSLLVPGADPETFWNDAGLSEAGRLIKNWLWAK
jgi:endoglucanase